MAIVDYRLGSPLLVFVKESVSWSPHVDALNKQYLIMPKKFALIKECALLNSKVQLTTRFCSRKVFWA